MGASDLIQQIKGTDTREVKCLNCHKIQQISTTGVQQYFKCSACSAIICLHHNVLMSKCLCFCPNPKCQKECSLDSEKNLCCNFCQVKFCRICKQNITDKKMQQKCHCYCITCQKLLPKAEQLMSDSHCIELIDNFKCSDCQGICDCCKAQYSANRIVKCKVCQHCTCKSCIFKLVNQKNRKNFMCHNCA